MSRFWIFLSGSVLGAAAGVLASMRYFKKKYSEYADEEIASVKEVYSKKSKQTEDTPSIISSADKIISQVKEQTVEAVKEMSSTYLTNDTSAVEEDDIERPYVISAQEVNLGDDWDFQTWTYHSNGILIDDFGDIVQKPSYWIGDTLDLLLSTETIYVRNPRLRTDYEVIYTSEPYTKRMFYDGYPGEDDENDGGE